MTTQDEWLAEIDARREEQRKAREELEQMDKAIADILGVEVHPAEDVWGWIEVATGNPFSPTDDDALAFSLVQRFELSITFHETFVELSYRYGRGRYGPLTTACQKGAALNKAICLAVMRKDELDRNIP